MALQHRAFLFDAKGFQTKISPLLRILENGNARPVFNEALKVVHETNSEDWILNSLGDWLFDIEEVDDIGKPYKVKIDSKLENLDHPDPSMIGYWLLIVMSEFLKDCNGIGIDYSILKFCLEKVGWNRDEINLLICGRPTSLLLKADTNIQPERLSLSDSYWFWMRPAHTNGGGGWLTQQQISHFLELIEKSRPLINDFSPSQFGTKMGSLSISVPDGQIDYLYRAHRAFDSAYEMLNKAKNANKELFMAIAYT